MRTPLVGLALSSAPGHGRYVPLGHRTLDDGIELDGPTTLERLVTFLGDPAVRVAGHDLKMAAIVLARHGAPLALDPADTDTMIASYLIDATRSTHAVEELALEQIGYKAIEPDALFGRGAKARLCGDLPAEAVVEWGCERSDLVLQLAERLTAQLEQDQLVGLYRDLELPLIPVLVAVERAGVRVDVDALHQMSARFERELATLQGEIYALAGAEFNINSPKQLSEVLFDKLQLPTSKRTGKTRVASTSVAVLEELASVHDLPRKVLDWRSLQKLKGTYIDALPQLVDPDTGRVPHLVQPGRRRDRPPEQPRPQFAEHPDPDAAGSRDPRSVRRRARAPAHLRRLLPDRVAGPGSPVGRREPRGGLPAWR